MPLEPLHAVRKDFLPVRFPIQEVIGAFIKTEGGAAHPSELHRVSLLWQPGAAEILDAIHHGILFSTLTPFNPLSDAERGKPSEARWR